MYNSNWGDRSWGSIGPETNSRTYFSYAILFSVYCTHCLSVILAHANQFIHFIILFMQLQLAYHPFSYSHAHITSTSVFSLLGLHLINANKQVKEESLSWNFSLYIAFQILFAGWRICWNWVWKIINGLKVIIPFPDILCFICISWYSIDNIKLFSNLFFSKGIYGLEDAVAEIKGLKKQLKIRNSEIESLIKAVNKLEFKINDLLDENEDLREQLGMTTSDLLDNLIFK